jgi:hypothetical protein
MKKNIYIMKKTAKQESFLEGLSRIDRVLYDSAASFQAKYGKDKSPEACHKAGLQKLININKMRNQPAPVWVDITTGKQHRANH